MLGEVPCPPLEAPGAPAPLVHSLFTLPRPAPIPPCTKQSPDHRLSHRCSSPGGSPLAPPGFPRPSPEISAKQATLRKLRHRPRPVGVPGTHLHLSDTALRSLSTDSLSRETGFLRAGLASIQHLEQAG